MQRILKAAYLRRSFSTISNMLFSWQNNSTRCWDTTGSDDKSLEPGDEELTPIPQSNNNCLQEGNKCEIFSLVSGAIDHSRKYHNIAQYSLFVTPKFCVSIVFSFSWGHFYSQEKLKTMLMQNFGVTNKKHYGMLWYFLEWSIQDIQVNGGGLELSAIARFITSPQSWWVMSNPNSPSSTGNEDALL